MGLQATFVLYMVIGVGVEAALAISRDDPPVARWFTTLTGVLFWPLYVPILLAPQEESSRPAPRRGEDLSTAETPKQGTDENSAEQSLSQSAAPALQPPVRPYG